MPYDVGYVWRQGNESRPDDVLAADLAVPVVTRRIRRFLRRYADGEGRLVEKTVGNTLRVPFVAEVVPQAIFVHLVRDGVDVVESSRRQWSAPVDLAYLARKVRHFPPRLAGSYGLKFVRNNLRQREGQKHVKSWGPRYPHIDVDLKECDLLTVCARQWRECVIRASADLEEASAPVIEVRYEHLVGDPVGTLGRIIDEAPGYRTTTALLAAAGATLHSQSAGSGRGRLADEERRLIDVEIGDTLERFGYDRV